MRNVEDDILLDIILDLMVEHDEALQRIAEMEFDLEEQEC